MPGMVHDEGHVVQTATPAESAPYVPGAQSVQAVPFHDWPTRQQAAERMPSHEVAA